MVIAMNERGTPMREEHYEDQQTPFNDFFDPTGKEP
jgi:hypothetical protein